MRKIAKVATVIAIAGFALIGCGANPGQVPGDTKDFSVEIANLGGEQFKCIFEDEGGRGSGMSCEKLDTQDGLGKSDTEDYSRDVITIGGEKYDCLFKNRGMTGGGMSCEPLEK